ncbi:unnamed protein product [Darwinula stevensoni]|uniref:Complex III assembly factor LYRM7 n=1 Tax=Darwinula stevensoni TaxID=69355 RepID=A0A7R8XFD8_9CRUS|nr:unnamed protein product [Darwinula stevensoni]CAG0894922.1 unnamed protein product [Darwinula stevensoni]
MFGVLRSGSLLSSLRMKRLSISSLEPNYRVPRVGPDAISKQPSMAPLTAVTMWDPTCKLVFRSYRRLLRTSQRVFDKDFQALQAAREEIRKGFKDKKHINDTETITQLIKYADEVEEVLRTSVIQGQRMDEDKYRLMVREDVQKFDNIPYRDS